MRINELANTYQRLKRFWIRNNTGILLLIIITAAITNLRYLPYFNLILTPGISVLVIWLCAMPILKLPNSVSVWGAGCALVLTGLAILFGQDEISSEAANFAYYLLWITFIIYIFSLSKKNAQ